MNLTEVKEIVRQELPHVLRTDKTFRYVIQDMLRESFASKQETENRFEQMLKVIKENQAEIRAMREESERKWKKQQAKDQAWHEESERKWKKQQAKDQAWHEESERKWKEQQAKDQAWHEESERKWKEQRAENQARREESERKWKEQQAENQARREEMRLFINKYNSSVGALGSRWGLHSEQSFRNALKSILEVSFGVQVLNITEYDDEGEVFGHPDQIELDIIIKNGLLIICELKSSISRSDMYIFGRKVQFYEKHHDTKATRQIVISPMVDKHAYRVAEKLGIEVYSYAEDVKQMRNEE
ncbi:DUF3782 domain-containing protein [Anaerolineales bacterium HSG24]|nr:DUF3782 domain-containing protein [Anaerolineales bacterium HSG24]